MRILAATACAAGVIGASITAPATPAHAGILPTSIAALQKVDTSHVVDVRWGWRGGGWGYRGWGGYRGGWGYGGAALAAGLIGGALLASSSYAYGYPAYGYGYPAYGYGYPGYGYGYPAYGYGYGYRYPAYGYGYAPYYGGYAGYGYARPYYRRYYAYAPYRRAYWRRW
jgi:hypothetical protein